jgi:hypothetical protein
VSAAFNRQTHLSGPPDQRAFFLPAVRAGFFLEKKMARPKANSGADDQSAAGISEEVAATAIFPHTGKKAAKTDGGVFVYSTLVSDQKYTTWSKGGGDLHVAQGFVVIKGGTNVANKNTATPIGTVTVISDEQLAQLEQNPMFKRHKERGFIIVTRGNTAPEKGAADMDRNDPSSPKTPANWNDSDIKPRLNTDS